MSDLSARTAVIVDGHPLWLDALESLLKRLQVQVVGRATQAQDAGRLIAEHAPDVLVTDYSAVARTGDPSTNWSALAQARAANPDVKCIVLSEADDPRERELAFAAGAAVFCVKRTEPDDLAAAIRQSFDHSIYLAQVHALPQAALNDQASGPGLTRRELEILQLVAEGHSNSQLAKMLWVTEQTVKFHLSNVYRKLDVANRTEASRWAQRHSLLSQTPAPLTATSAA